MLMKMFTTMGAFPKFMDVEVHHKEERLRAWRVAVETKLATTRPVVSQWFEWCWSVANQHYGIWLKTHVLRRSEIRITTPLPQKFQWIDSHMQPKIFDAMPPKLQSVIRQESLSSIRKTVVEMCFLLLQLATDTLRCSM